MGEIAKRALASLAAARTGPAEIWISLAGRDTVLAAAAVVESRLRAGESLPLAGLTAAVKDNIDVAGLPTTAACPAYAYTPVHDAPVVAALVGAGAVVIGKTNMDQFATGLVGTRSPYGIVRNPVDPRYIAGGSSSGSAAAVALGQVDIALATDTAGSGRVPAALNGIVGFKPTQALLSREGVVPACPSFDCVSVLAPTVVLAHSATEALCRTPLPFAARRRRIAVPGTPPDLDDDRRVLWETALARLSNSGASLETVDLSDFFEAGNLLYRGAFVAERYAAVGEFATANRSHIDPTVWHILHEGAGVPAHALIRDRERLERLRERVQQFFTCHDAVVVPTTAFHPTVEEIIADPTGPNHQLGLYNHFCNPLELAAVTIPAGRTNTGLPFGINLYGPAASDTSLLHLAARFTGETLPPIGRPPGPLLAVAGAHLRGQPLNHQLVDLGASFVEQTTTAAHYRLYALPTTPPKPGLIHTTDTGAAIEVEVWLIDEQSLTRLLSSTPWPLAFGTVELADGRNVIGFVCQAGAEHGASDITAHGGWRAYLQAVNPASPP